MSEFEYLRSLPIGQYVPGDSIVHRLDARARILVFTLLAAATLFTPRPLGLLLGVAAVLVGLGLARLPLGYSLRSLLAPLPFLLILAALQVFFNAVPDSEPVLVRIGPLTVTPADLQAGGIMLLRFAMLVMLISFATQVISTSEMARGLESLLSPLERLRLPVHDALMALVVAVRFLPFLAQSAERIAKAQASRGAEWAQGGGGLLGKVRALLPLLVPVFITSLRRAETMALAMDARGYASRTRPTSLMEFHFRWRDGLVVAAVLILAVAMFIL